MESPGWANQASSYSAEQTRRAAFAWAARTAANTDGILAGGLLSASDLQISAPGSGLSCNISVGAAIVGGSEGGTQGGYYARNASTTNLPITTANPTNPRIDTVCLTIADAGYTEPTGVSGNAAVLQVVTGTATSGANLTNLSGKAGLPLSSLLLGYVLVPAAASNIVSGDISNRAIVVSLLAGSNYLQLLSSQTLQMATGQATLTWGGSSTVSASAAVTHNLGRVPTFIGLSTNLTSTGGATNFPNWQTGVTTTTFHAISTAGSTPANGETVTLTWVVVG